MASEWIRLTKRDKEFIDINLANVSSIEKDLHGGSEIWFLTGVKEGKVAVTQTMDAIQDLIAEKQKNAHRT